MQDMVDASAWQRDARELRDVLNRATGDRKKRPDFDPASGELGWVLHERGVMHDAVNRLRARYGKSPVEATEIASAETRACGHIDYANKFAYGAADIVHRA